MSRVKISRCTSATFAQATSDHQLDAVSLGSIHPEIMPVTARAYAGVNNMFVSINNSSAPRSWPSRFITPDGLVGASLPTDEPGVMVNVVDLDEPYYDASGPFRPDALRGKLNSGEAVDDPRSEDRTSH